MFNQEDFNFGFFWMGKGVGCNFIETLKVVIFNQCSFLKSFIELLCAIVWLIRRLIHRKKAFLYFILYCQKLYTIFQFYSSHFIKTT